MPGIQLTQCYAEYLEEGDVIDITRRPWRVLKSTTTGAFTTLMAESVNDNAAPPKLFRVPKQMIFKIRKTALV